MVNAIEFIFYVYLFIALYMTSLLFFIYLPHRKKLFNYLPAKPVPVSIVMPCYNDASTIGPALESLLNLDYPAHMTEIIVVDDKSKDNSREIVQQYVSRYPGKIRLLLNAKNSGGAAQPTNIGILHARYDYIAVADSDSTPEKDALKKMIGFLQHDPRVAAVTCAVMVRNPQTFMQKLQAIEYAIIAWNRKLLDFVDAVYVTPGPFALYRKAVLIDVGLFDTKNLTQDIEIVWRLRSYNYTARMCLATRVYAESPQGFKRWWKQRSRWNLGGLQTLWKYKSLFLKKGMLGAFIIPFFSFSLFLGLFGLSLFTYLFTKRIIIKFLATKYAIYGGATILRFQDLALHPTVLNFFGILLFFIGVFFTLFGLGIMNELKAKHVTFYTIVFYMLIYLAVYPLIMLKSLYRAARKEFSW